MRLTRRSDIGIMYEEKNAATLTETMALKAAVLPMLIRARSSDMIVLVNME